MASRMKDYQIACLAMLPTHGAHEAGRWQKDKDLSIVSHKQQRCQVSRHTEWQQPCCM